VTVQSQLRGANVFICDFPLTFRRVKNHSYQVIRVRPAHQLKVF